MAKLTLTDLTSLTNEASAIATINANHTLIEAALENTLSRDGTTPNTMSADFDMNSNDILNVGTLSFDTGETFSDSAVALKFTFDDSTTMADPGAGDVRFNNATLSSVTAIAFDATSASTGNPDVSDFIAAWDDVTNAVASGYLTVRKKDTPATFAIFRVTAVTDNTGWLQVTVTHVTSNGTFAASDICYIGFTLSGADGSGTFPGSSTDNAFPRFNGAGGSTLQNSQTTEDDSGNVTITGTVAASNLSGTNTGDESSATTSAEGIVEIATQAEVDAGSDTSRVVTPDTLANYANFPAGGGPSKGTNAIIRTNALNVIEDITLNDHSATFTADTGADTLSVGTDDGFANEDRVYVSSDGTLPTGLSASTEYHVVGITATTLQLAATNGGSAIDITGAGSGTHTIYQAINGMSAGPITVESGHTVTVSEGSTWSVV